MLEVQKFLQDHRFIGGHDCAIQKLYERFGIKCKEYDDRIVLNYSQYESPKFETIVRECRGLILRKSDYFVLSAGFKRFFNYGEAFETTRINWTNACLQEKVDGSYIQLYFDGYDWQIGTKNTAFGECQFNGVGKIARELVSEALGFASYEDLKKELKNHYQGVGPDKKCTYIFEYVGPYNQVVTKYVEPCCYLLGAFMGGSEFMVVPSVLDCMKYRLPERHYIGEQGKNIEYVKQKTDQLNANRLDNPQEGYVLWDGDIRVKFKNAYWMTFANNYAFGNISESKIIDLIADGDYDELLEVFPKMKDRFYPYKKAFEKLIEDVMDKYQQFVNLDWERKDLWDVIKYLYCSHILVKMIDKNQTFEEVWQYTPGPAKRRVIKKYMEK